MLVPMNVILEKAARENYGVAAPNVFNMDTVLATFQAASELKAPLIIDCADKFDLEVIGELTRFYEKKYPEVPVALNLDHGKTYGAAVRAIKAGFTSVMVDRSQMPFEDNVRETAEIVKMAHAVGVSVEAELGHVGRGSNYSEDRDAGLTAPADALKFVEKTSVDCLAIAIGTAHGQYVGTPVLDYDRLMQIRKIVSVPLVLHGGSSTGDENLKKAVELGIAKVNLSTDLNMAGAKQVKELIGREASPSLLAITLEGAAGYKEMLKHYMKLFNSAGRA